MRKLSTTQKAILVMGIIGTSIGLYGKFNGWEYDSYFVFFYTGMTLMWVAFLNSGKSCCRPFWKKQPQNQ